MIKSTHGIVALATAAALGMLAMAVPNGPLTTPITQAQTSSEKHSFKVFDGTLYADKPDLCRYGVQSITITYARHLGNEWFKNETRLPDKASVQRAEREAEEKGTHVVLDIEHWPLQGDPQKVRDSLSQYMTVLQWFKEAAPGLAVGYYGAPPLRDYWRASSPPTSKEWRSYADENDRLRPLAEAVDILFPSLYTFYEDQGGWVRYAYGQIAEARRSANGKPVYVFLMPQYHDSNRKLAGTYLPPDYWRLELETAKQYADGVIFWGGWGSNNRPARWDENASWWQVTKEFMTTIKPSN